MSIIEKMLLLNKEKHMNSKLIKAFNWIFTFLLVISLYPFFAYQGDKQLLVLIVMLVAIVASTISYIPYDEEKNEKQYHIAYLTSYLSHIVIIVVMFLLALWELNTTNMIGTWFYVLLLTIALIRPVITLLIKAFK